MKPTRQQLIENGEFLTEVFDKPENLLYLYGGKTYLLRPNGEIIEVEYRKSNNPGEH